MRPSAYGRQNGGLSLLCGKKRTKLAIGHEFYSFFNVVIEFFSSKRAAKMNFKRIKVNTDFNRMV